MKQIVDLIDEYVKDPCFTFAGLKNRIENLRCGCDRGKPRLFCYKCGQVGCEDCISGWYCSECRR